MSKVVLYNILNGEDKISTKQKDEVKMAKSNSSSTVSKKRGRAPRERHEGILNMMRPRPVEDVKEIARRLVADESVSLSFLNNCIMSAKEYNKEVGAVDEVVEQYEADVDRYKREGGRKPNLPTLPARTPIYQPPVWEAMKRINPSRVAYMGKGNKKPAGWDDNLLGEWNPEVHAGCRINDGPLRPSHVSDIRRRCREDCVVAIGDWEYIIGTDKESAVFCYEPCKGGNYAANVRAGLKLSLDGVKEIENLVGRINRDIYVDELDNGSSDPIVYLPHQVVQEWGYLQRDGKTLSYEQIRKAVADNEKGIKFVPSQPIVGNSFNQSKLFQTVKRMMELVGTKDTEGNDAWDRFKKRNSRFGKNSDDIENVWRNMLVLTRTNPHALFVFGLDLSQGKVVFVPHYSEDGETLLLRAIVGVSIGSEWREDKFDARSRVAQESGEPVEKPKRAKKVEEKTVKSKPKQAKPKTEKAVVVPARKKRAKKSEAAVETTEVAPVEESQDESVVNSEVQVAGSADIEVGATTAGPAAEESPAVN